MKAINIQRRRLMTSLALSALAAAPGASWAQTAAKALAPARGARIVVVGAGVGGATAAKYLKLFNKNLDVTLIDRNPNFIRHYGSSELITGAVTMEDLTVSYDALSDRYGVRVVRDTIVGLDADRRTVIGEKGRYAYDKLIVSPGIELLYEGIPGYSAELAATKIPSGWIAGPQTQLLADQLKAMPQGGTFCLVAPPNPYRCPPGPYERAALADADWKARMTETALRTGRRIHVASGAIGGFDVLRTAALMGVEEATFESTKSPKSLSGAPGLMGVELPADRETLAFEGGVEEAVRGFPKNINVAAATASAADAPNVRVRLVARPGLTVNTHHIDVKAGEMHCELFFHSAYDPKNPRSSTSTAWSVLALLKNLESPISYF